MNMLTDSLPKALTIAGREYIINTDYKKWIRYEQLLTSTSEQSDEELFEEILKLVFPKQRPLRKFDRETAEQIMWFYRCGKEEKKSGSSGGEEIFSYDYDDGYITAAFKQQYGINLNRERIHWWEFHAYMLALSEDTEFVKIMGIRVMKIDPKLPASEKSYYQRMKQLYKLPVDREVEEQTRRIEEALMNGESIDDLMQIDV